MTDNLLDNEIPATAEMPIPSGSSNKPANLPEKFWDDQNQTIRLESLINSYLALEKRLSTTVDLPQSEDDKFAIMRKLGMPETPEEYEVQIPHAMFSIDPDVNTRLHKCGCTGEQVQEVYNLASEKMLPMIMQIAAEHQADREVEKLVNHFGGPEKWREVSRQLLTFGQKTLPPKVLDNMASTYEGVIALYKMMMGEEPVISDAPADKITASGEQELQALMRDPKYWRDRDPATVAKVTEGYRKIYAE